MKLIGFKRFVLAALVAVGFLVSVGSIPANAQGRAFCRPRRVVFYRRYDPFWDSYRWQTYRVVDPIASQREQGYGDGFSRGKDDARDGRENDPYDEKLFNKSHSLAYREAFLKGYADGYRKY